MVTLTVTCDGCGRKAETNVYTIRKIKDVAEIEARVALRFWKIDWYGEKGLFCDSCEPKGPAQSTIG